MKIISRLRLKNKINPLTLFIIVYASHLIITLIIAFFAVVSSIGGRWVDVRFKTIVFDTPNQQKKKIQLGDLNIIFIIIFLIFKEIYLNESRSDL